MGRNGNSGERAKGGKEKELGEEEGNGSRGGEGEGEDNKMSFL